MLIASEAGDPTLKTPLVPFEHPPPSLKAADKLPKSMAFPALGMVI